MDGVAFMSSLQRAHHAGSQPLSIYPPIDLLVEIKANPPLGGVDDESCRAPLSGGICSAVKSGRRHFRFLPSRVSPRSQKGDPQASVPGS